MSFKKGEYTLYMNIKNIVWMALVVIALGIGFILGRSGIETPLNDVADSTANIIEKTTKENTESSAKIETAQDENKVQNNAATTGGLSEGQRTMLKSFGLNPDEVTLTPVMIACAEAKVGKARVDEIMSGATPSFIEGASLVACYK